MRCRDDKGEGFREVTNQTSGDKSFVLTCGDLLNGNRGLECYTLKENASCPDLAVKFYCRCDPKPSTYAHSNTTQPYNVISVCRYFNNIISKN